MQNASRDYFRMYYDFLFHILGIIASNVVTTKLAGQWL
jgi:hypothetical protein